MSEQKKGLTNRQKNQLTELAVDSIEKLKTMKEDT